MWQKQKNQTVQKGMSLKLVPFPPVPNASLQRESAQSILYIRLGKNYLPANIYFKNFTLMESDILLYLAVFCYLCLTRSFCIRIYRNTSVFLMTVWFSNVGMCYKCSNTERISGCSQYFTIAKPYCSEHSYNEIIPRVNSQQQNCWIKGYFSFSIKQLLPNCSPGILAQLFSHV